MTADPRLQQVVSRMAVLAYLLDVMVYAATRSGLADHFRKLKESAHGERI